MTNDLVQNISNPYLLIQLFHTNLFIPDRAESSQLILIALETNSRWKQP